MLRIVSAPFVLLRALSLPVLILGAGWIGWHEGLDLWSDIKNREIVFVPTTGVRLTELKCPGPTCMIKFDGGLSAMGRNHLSYNFLNSLSDQDVKLVRSTRDGSIAMQFARDRLGERSILLVCVELFLIAVIITLTRYTWRSIKYFMRSP